MTAGGGFCCDMKAMTREERGRYKVLRAKLEAAVVSVREMADGYRLQLRGEGISAEELAEWIEFEKKCCPFFTLEMSQEGESRELRITGGEGVKDFVRAEFTAIRFE